MPRPRRRLFFLIVSVLVAGLAGWFVLAWLEHTYRAQDDETTGVACSLIEPGLAMGGYVREPPQGTSAVLNLCETEDRYHCATHRWEPIRDTAPAPDLDWLRRMVQFIDAQRRGGDTVFVHCRAGVSRSGMVVVAYLMFEHGWTRDEALDFVRTKRPLVRPNPAFMERLAEWEAALAAEAEEHP